MKKIAVIGAGISGLSTAWMIREKAKAKGLTVDIKVIEGEERTGGKIKSIQEEGYLCEWGPNGFLDSKPNTLKLCDNLGISSKLLRSNDNARKRFIYSEGKLHKLPENAATFLSSELISFSGKLRLAMEPTPFIKPAPKGVYETLADFARRRLGGEALDKLIAPMVSGIFAGDPETMSLISCFPRIAELEREYGGLIKAMIKLAKKKKEERKAGKQVASAAGPGGVLTSFRDGIQFLTDALTDALKDSVIRSFDVVSVSYDGASYLIKDAAGNSIEADIVVSAAPAYSLAKMVENLNPQISETLNQIKYATLSVVCCGYEREKIAHPLDGFGYLIPKKEGKSILGTLWDSSMFENRAASGRVLLRSMVGGACFPQYVDLSDEEIINRVQNDLKDVMGIDASPSFYRIFRHKKAIPQYTVGHCERLAKIDALLKEHPRLIFTGNAFRGIGINDCVASSETASDKVVELI